MERRYQQRFGAPTALGASQTAASATALGIASSSSRQIKALGAAGKGKGSRAQKAGMGGTEETRPFALALNTRCSGWAQTRVLETRPAPSQQRRHRPNALEELVG